MDSELRYKKHIANVATKGLQVALALQRLKLISPSTARQLLGAMVAPGIDYASNVRMHALKVGAKTLNRVQMIGVQAVIGLS